MDAYNLSATNSGHYRITAGTSVVSVNIACVVHVSSHSSISFRGRPWRYSVIPSTPDFPTEYQIRRYSNPAGLPTFAAIWGPDFRASIIRLTCPHVFKQIQIYNYFDDDVQSQSSPTKLRRPTVGSLISMQRRGTRRRSPEIVGCVFCGWLLGSYCLL